MCLVIFHIHESVLCIERVYVDVLYLDDMQYWNVELQSKIWPGGLTLINFPQLALLGCQSISTGKQTKRGSKCQSSVAEIIKTVTHPVCLLECDSLAVNED